MAVTVQVDTTPNENALKFTINQPAIESGHKTFPNAETAEELPVAKALFALEGVTSVFLMADFITVTKKPEVSWDGIQANQARPGAKGAALCLRLTVIAHETRVEPVAPSRRLVVLRSSFLVPQTPDPRYARFSYLG